MDQLSIVQEISWVKELTCKRVGSTQQNLFMSFVICEVQTWSHKKQVKNKNLYWSLDCLHGLNGS